MSSLACTTVTVAALHNLGADNPMFRVMFVAIREAEEVGYKRLAGRDGGRWRRDILHFNFGL
jgi:hypothetical protein